MGVPKFFRYTSERYPCLNELVKQYQIPDFDNMYLDMNGIIHNCSHPDDSNPHFRITEEKIFSDIFHYIGILFQIIKPKKLFFMAIDGVAPRAKMNQQRGRRFRSAREAEKLEEDAKAKGEVLPTEERFDSNCITPGTVFMARLHEQLRFFIKQKISVDPLWSKVKVILSGHETPGEGEHKIMDYIRWARSQPDYDPNTRHCLYGLDADLIMLGMCTHEPHFALLREEVKFGKSTQRASSPEETNFYLLHLSLLREYLEQEFIAIKDNLPFPYDIEKIVDDWVLMGFLVGNDFIPNLPNMHISNDALPLLYKTYMAVLPTLDGYINEAGDLHLGRFEIFMQELAKIDKEKFQDTYADLKYFEAKTGRRPNAQERKEYKPNNDDTFNVNIDDIKQDKPDDELQALIDATKDMYMDDLEIGDEEYDDTSDEEANFESEFLLHKKDYYMNKLDYSKVTSEVLADQAEGYVRAIQWNLFYYYKGCPSWCWYYPHHYAPYMSDIKGFKDLNIQFELGEPFKPFEQLLAVLPAASKHLLPAPFHELMTSDASPIFHYYPVHFETDLNGKRNDWEAVVLIPFINEENLLSAMAPCYEKLTPEELKRNTPGPMLVYNWVKDSLGPVSAPEYFAPLAACHAHERPVWRQELHVPEAQLKRGMLPNAERHLLYPGFPTMRHLKYKTYLKKCKVKVFDQPSRNENMILELVAPPGETPQRGPLELAAPPGEAPQRGPLELEALAHQLLGTVVWVGWPHLTKAKVVSVSNEKMRIHHTGDKKGKSGAAAAYCVEPNAGNLHQQWLGERSSIIEHHKNRLGIELGSIDTIVHAVNLRGYKWMVEGDSRVALEAEWCGVACGHALQAVVRDAREHAVRRARRLDTPADAYPPGSGLFLLTRGPYYGCYATVVDPTVVSGRIKVQIHASDEPRARAASVPSDYRPAHHAAAECGISAQMLSRITGTVLVVAGARNDLPTETQEKVNIGLNLKFNKKNQEVSGYTRRCGATGAWLYSARCRELVRDYTRHYPELFERLAHAARSDVYFESDLWPDQVGEKKQSEVAGWVKRQPHAAAARRACGSEALEEAQLHELARDVAAQLADLALRPSDTLLLKVKLTLLYKPELHEGNTTPDRAADFKLFDRVVCVATNITVPLGAKGIITAVYAPSDSNTVRLSDKLNAEPTYQVMFDEPFPGASTEGYHQAIFYRMLPTNMLNISFGRNLRLEEPPEAVGAEGAEGEAARRPERALRPAHRHDHYASAFADYSSPKEERIPVSNRTSNSNRTSVSKMTPASSSTPVFSNASVSSNTSVASKTTGSSKTTQSGNNAHVQDNGTQLLRSLLKISSQTDKGTVPDNKYSSDSCKNWRSADNTAAAPQEHSRPPENWRAEGLRRKAQAEQQVVPQNRNLQQNQQSRPSNSNMAQPYLGPNQIQNPQYQTQQQYQMPNPAYRHQGNPQANRNYAQTHSHNQGQNLRYFPPQNYGVQLQHANDVTGHSYGPGPDFVHRHNQNHNSSRSNDTSYNRFPGTNVAVSQGSSQRRDSQTGPRSSSYVGVGNEQSLPPQMFEQRQAPHNNAHAQPSLDALPLPPGPAASVTRFVPLQVVSKRTSSSEHMPRVGGGAEGLLAAGAARRAPAAPAPAPAPPIIQQQPQAKRPPKSRRSRLAAHFPALDDKREDNK